jgi:HPt (histidine-containing phosphotransfer) domain-containing protein
MVKHYNLASLTEMLGGDKEAKLRMIDIFLQATPETLAELNKSYQERDYKRVGELAHKLKSSVDIFEISEVKEDVRNVVKNCRQAMNLDQLYGLIGKINDVLSETFVQIREERDSLQLELKQFD